jgi:hypothetical protein
MPGLAPAAWAADTAVVEDAVVVAAMAAAGTVAAVIADRQ